MAFFSDKAYLLDDTLEYVDLFSRIKLLQKWNILDKRADANIINLFNELKQVRNGSAHRWKESEVNYKNQKLTLNIQQFKEDLEEVWKTLIQKYMQEKDRKNR